MQPAKFHRAVDAAIRRRLSMGDNSLFTAALVRRMEREWRRRVRREGDPRTGDETYGYAHVEDQLSYISDRWCCGIRLRWLLDGLARGAI
ncbi:hypothetical protein [Defluviimonas salinarum]|uniref:Uncharacterized protein n=1 Tax=Defluviimonas salinarum TaxID=2992147 RepID=A0ABT3J5H5_9RHOB|nr:hypothetical protein [Defluviimonas salinarum]MCW3782947.1 hypothetical protein [Defluviimonas salinarum]